MSQRAFHFATAAAVLLFAAETNAQAVEKVVGYDTFRLVRTRNMFDPNRRPVRVETPTTQRSTPVRQNRSSSLTLTGTMVTDGKVLAFFNGTRADFSKVLSVGDTIADCKITAIKPAEVEMERAGKPTVLAVGNQLQIEGLASDVPIEEPPAATPATPTSPDAAGGPTIPAVPAPGTTPPTSAPATSNDKNDVLRRMMERRAKEMSK